MQGYIDNEVNINKDGTCQNTCDEHTITRQYHCQDNTLCSPNYLDTNKTKCHGNIRDCVFVESDLWVCPNVSSFPYIYALE